MKRNKSFEIISRMLSVAVIFLLIFALSPESSFAASKKGPAKVTGVSASAAGDTSINLRWKKVKKGAKGYGIFRDGQLVATLSGAKSVSFTDAGLEPGTKYSYTVRAYKIVKTKKWFNKKTGKWQKKKPPKRSRGKSKKFSENKYGKASSTVSARTTGQVRVGARGASSLDDATIQSEMLRQINERRAAAGVPPLEMLQVMNDLAKEKAYDMFSLDYFDHKSPTWGNPGDQYRRYNLAGITGENIAWGQGSIDQVMNAWMNSPGHRANILNPESNQVGVAYYGGYWVQQFAKDLVDYSCPQCGADIRFSAEDDYYTASFAYPKTSPTYQETQTVRFFICNSCRNQIYYQDSIAELENKLSEWTDIAGVDCLNFVTWKNSKGEAIDPPFEFEVSNSSVRALGIDEVECEEITEED